MLSQSSILSIIVTDNAHNATGMTGQEIIAARSLTLPSDNEDDDARGLEDAAELPFGNDAAEQQEHRPSNQTRSLFNKRNKIILGSCIGAILLMFVAGLFSSTALTDRNNNNSMVVESYNNGAKFQRDESPTSAPTATKSSKSKASKAPTECVPNDPPTETTNCDNCCDNCVGDPSICTPNPFGGGFYCTCDEKDR